MAFANDGELDADHCTAIRRDRHPSKFAIIRDMAFKQRRRPRIDRQPDFGVSLLSNRV
jgi:hypothetical protein